MIGQTQLLIEFTNVELTCYGINYEMKLSNGNSVPSFIIFNPSSISFTISTQDNSKIGSYNLVINVLNYDSSSILNSFSFKLIIQGSLVTLNTNSPYF
jgi:hypothetical protein